MERSNQTSVNEFILLGLTDDPTIQLLLFILFLLIYIMTVLGNIGIITIIMYGSSLHTPMYFFLCNLSLSDFCNSSVIVPKMLKDLLTEKKSISFRGCAAQTFFFVLFASMSGYMLSAMAFDRYAAICQPLLYHLIVNRNMCIQLVTSVYVAGLLTATAQTICTFDATFCGPNVIDHFFCDMPPLMKLSCSDPFIRETVIFAVVLVLGFASALVTVTSYVYILSTILHIRSKVGKKKAFSTCGSHMTAIMLFYGTTIFMYLKLPSSKTVTQDKLLSVCYTIVLPMVNPLIYSLRNQEVKGVVKKIIQWKQSDY